LADLHTLAKQEGPSRLTAYAHCCAADDHPMALQTDLAAYNRYWGWYDGELTDVGPWADKLHAKLPSKPIGLGEYGAGASALQQEDPPKRPVPNSRWHPEQYQALFHEAYARQIAARPFLWGTFVWLGFDHASADRNEGDATGINDKGLVSYDRKLRKDAYYLYQAYWGQQPMVHISSSRFSPRSSGEVAVKAYTNGKQATLTLDGHSPGAVSVNDHVAQWSTVALTPGRHRLSVSTDHGASDAIEWVCTP
jgi:beta-galactosidase